MTMKKRPKMKDVAEAAGVSLSTVDRILNRRGTVSAATVAHVLRAAERIGYHGVPTILGRLTEGAPEAKFGFILNSRSREFYAELAHILQIRCDGSTQLDITHEIIHLDKPDDRETAEALRALSRTCSAIAIVAIDGPATRQAIAEANVPVFALLSPLRCPEIAGFIGANGEKMGRGTGWLMRQLCRKQGVVAILLGSIDYDIHRAYDVGLRDYLAESEMLTVLPYMETRESDQIAYEIVSKLLATEPDLAGLAVLGGGLRGAADALANFAGPRVPLVGTEHCDAGDAELRSGRVDAIISHSIYEIAEKVVRQMEEATLYPEARLLDTLDIRIDIRIAETI
ncbi:LacI family DNA-binding transcriptional regulator [Thioclava sp. GXIMD2076]|uniref:LacI family DNA-binding transcriptional regulator n=1 Tax=Thioclava sp. GXIMD2076 TaxID=3131931 RepID=UPI0030CD87D8